MDFWFAMLLFIGTLVACLMTGIPIAVALFAGCIVFYVLARCRGFAAKPLFKMALKGGIETMGVVRNLIFIGFVTASWRASGTIAVFIAKGLSVITPSLFILITFLLTALLAYAMGTCFGVVGTVGVIFMALARSGGVNELYTAGAILSGAYFGDRGAPLSASANLVAGVTGTSLYDNVKYMHLTALLPLSISVILYFILSSKSPIASVDTSILSDLAAHYNLSWWCILPTVIMLLLPILKVPLKYAIPASVLAACILAMMLQDMPFLSFLRCCIFGYTADNAVLDRILGGGGVVSMISICLLVLFSGMISGIFNGTGMLGGLHSIIRPLEARIGGFPAMALTSVVICAIFCNQTLAITMSKELWKDIYEDEHISHREFAIDMENSAVIISGLIPWAISCSVPFEMLGVDAHALPYGFLLYLLPLCYLFTKQIWFPAYARVGKKRKKEQ